MRPSAGGVSSGAVVAPSSGDAADDHEAPAAGLSAPGSDAALLGSGVAAPDASDGSVPAGGVAASDHDAFGNATREDATVVDRPTADDASGTDDEASAAVAAGSAVPGGSLHPASDPAERADDPDVIEPTSFLDDEPVDPAASIENAATPPAAGVADPRDGDPTAGHATDDAALLLTGAATVEPAAEWADDTKHPTALTWLDTDAVAARSVAVALESRTAGTDATDLLAGAKLRPGILRPRVLVPLGVVTALVAGYCATTLLWPLDNVAPEISASAVEIAPAEAATLTWPARGTASVAVDGIGTASSPADPSAIASLTKVVSAMMVLEALPLEPGEQGPSYGFTYSDSLDYWEYRMSDQSALDVPVGGSLTEYQLLQGVLLGSANNYIDRLAREIWGSDAAFAAAAQRWLSDRGLDDVRIVDPSGFDDGNVATPADMIRIGGIAMRHPVFAEIVATTAVDLPGAGRVENTNRMLVEDAGVIGIKTGSLFTEWNLLTAKDITVGGTAVRLYAAVLGQPDDKARVDASRKLYAEVEQSLAAQGPTVPAGTVVGVVDTEWGARSEIVTDADAAVVLWNGATATADTKFELGGRRAAGDEIGTLTATGPLGTAASPVSLADEIEDPSAWWRLTHPLELLGID